MYQVTRIVVRAGVVITAASLLGVLLLAGVGADTTPGWLSTDAPGLDKMTDLGVNQTPPLKNRDCTDYGYTTIDYKSTTGCFVATQQGGITESGSTITLPGDSLGVPLIAHTPNTTLVPVPGSQLTMLTSPEPVFGSYVHLYSDLSKALQANYSALLHEIQSFSIMQDPDEDIRDQNGTKIAFNTWDTLAFSANGTWMVADAPGLGFMRINLATLDITPFGSSLTSPGDSHSIHAETAISDDGRYAVVASYTYKSFKIYDLSTCTGATNATYSQPLSCQYRDYWPALSAGLDSFWTVYSIRFLNDDNLSVALTYKWRSTTDYSSALFRLTAPGKTAHGLAYLALGDSYISGEGEFTYRAGTDTAVNGCHLSPLSYPYTIGAERFDSYQSVACSGARANDITSTSARYTGQVSDHVLLKDRDVPAIESAFSPGIIPQLGGGR